MWQYGLTYVYVLRCHNKGLPTYVQSLHYCPYSLPVAAGGEGRVPGQDRPAGGGFTTPGQGDGQTGEPGGAGDAGGRICVLRELEELS